MTVQEKLEKHTNAIRKIINSKLKNNGDTCEFSQRVCLLDRISSFEHAANGITTDDLLSTKKDKHNE